MKKLNVFMLTSLLILALPLFAQNQKAFTAHDFPNAVSRLDACVENSLKEKGIIPSESCSDETFIRRLSLDITGRMPTANDARKFIQTKDPEKRGKLIDSLLQSDGFVEFQVLKWGDLLRCKSEFPSNLWPNAVQAYTRWMKESIRDDKSYDQFVRELLISSGSNFRSAGVNFYRAFQDRTPKNIAESFALIFLGMRPDTKYGDNKTPGDLSPFFSQLKYKKSEEWKEELVYNDRDVLPLVNSVSMPGGSKVALKSQTDFRIALVDWLTDKQNPYFAKVMANRVWFWLMGRGIVNEPDDFKESNPPSNPELLSFLEQEFKDHNYDVRYLFRLILNSRTYQRSSIVNESNHADEGLFSHYRIHRLTAEQLIDAICDITDVYEIYSSRVPEPFTFLPKDTRAVQLEDGTISTPVLEMFGRPSRDISYESDRNNNLTMKQVLFLLNSAQITDKINKSKKLKLLTDQSGSREKLISEVYLLVLNRFPLQSETATILTYFSNNKKDKYQNTSDLVWALINTKEFLFNH
ncbi:MAG: DUF1553 domain-containing protein [Bacteroidota bacterium]|nr:DUF1553 domain-containing protein [Bacteroidota bacterium]